MASVTFKALDRRNESSLAAEVVVDGGVARTTQFHLELPPGQYTAVFKETSTHTIEQPVKTFEVPAGSTAQDVTGWYHTKLRVNRMGTQKLGKPITIAGVAYAGNGFKDKDIKVYVQDTWGGAPTQSGVSNSGSWGRTTQGPAAAGDYGVVVMCLNEAVTITVKVRP